MKPEELIAQLAPGPLTGWEFVERQMGLQIESGVTTAQHWARHLDDAGLAASWKRFSDWKNEHPGEPVPPEINAVAYDRPPAQILPIRRDIG